MGGKVKRKLLKMHTFFKIDELSVALNYNTQCICRFLTNFSMLDIQPFDSQSNEAEI